MKRLMTVVLILGAALVVVCCSKTEKTLSLPEDYTNWERVNTEELNYPIPGHESNYRIIYINDIGKDVAISSKNGRTRYEFPEGTIIAKTVYEGLNPSPNAGPVMITAMVKNKEHQHARGGWVWIVKNLNTGEERLVEEAFCYTCHAAANESHPYSDGNPQEEFRDYVFFAAE